MFILFYFGVNLQLIDYVEILVSKLNDGLAKIKANGKYAEIYKKWFGKEPPAEDLKQVIEWLNGKHFWRL